MKKTYGFVFIITLVTMLISLYFSTYGDPLADIAAKSLFQGPGLEPCHLCRWGRIIMYPMVLLSFLGLLRGGKDYFVAIGSLSLIGICIATYHYYIQFFHVETGFLCTSDVPCNVVQWQVLGFVTLPLLEIVLCIGLGILSIFMFYKGDAKKPVISQ